MRKTKSRFITFFISIMLCLIVLEVALRIVGTIYSDLSESDKGTTDSVDVTTILSIGDSVTFGIGAPMDLSYPQQLETILNESDPEKNYTVINRGRPAQNSTQILMRLEAWLQEFQPDIVTILVGAQNQFNYFGYQAYLDQSDKEARGFLLSLHDSLDRIRIYKFVRLLIQQFSVTQNIAQEHLNEEEPVHGLYPKNEMGGEATPECVQGMDYEIKGEYEKAVESILSVVEKKKVESECYHIVGSIYRGWKQYDKAIAWFKRWVGQDPTDFRNYEGIGWSYYEQNQLKEAITWFRKGFENARYETLYELCYVGIGNAFQELGDIDGAIQFFEKETQRKPLVHDNINRLAKDYLFMFKNKRIDDAVHGWIRVDIEQILELCAHYNAKAILQNYPTWPELDHVYREVARQRNVPFVDQQKTFEKYIINGMLSDEYFVPDGHPNAKGYHLMAKNIQTVLQDSLAE